MNWNLQRLVKGARPTLLETTKGNELIDCLNVLGNITIGQGDQDAVEYDANGIRISYGRGLGDVTATLSFLNSKDPTQAYVVVIEQNQIISVSTETSGWVEKTIEICEDGSAVEYTFLVKSG